MRWDLIRPGTPGRLLPAGEGSGCHAAVLRCILLVCGLSWASAAVSQDKPARPYRDFRQQASPYAGPGRERAEPSAVSEVKIGYFGPNDPHDPQGGDLWKAAELAVDQANKQGGYHGKPFRLVPVWSTNPWGTGVSSLARLAYRDKVWAFLGGIDGPTAHLAEQVVAKALLPLVSPTSSDRTANVANVPWMFSVLPGDHQQAPCLAEALSARAGARGFAVISAQDHDSRIFLTELERTLKPHKLAPKFSHILAGDTPDYAAAARQAISENVAAVVISAGASPSARLVRALRSDGFKGLILGTHFMGRRGFVAEAGPAAEGVLFPLLCDPGSLPASFRKSFEKRYHIQPDYAAAHTYDSLTMLFAAIRRAGLNRARIGDAIRGLSPYQGVTGTITWDKLGSNTRTVRLGTIRAGQLRRDGDTSR
ncbi:MAG: ABC transporter substrate-binding protein [Isosphaeraceae bacterium]